MIHIDQVIEGCKKQKADCQKKLYQHFFGIMLGVCNRYLNSKEEAEEILNSGFLKIFVNINQYVGKGSFEGWMRRIMVHTCLDFLKSKQNRENSNYSNMSDVENAESFSDNLFFNAGMYSENLIENNYSHKEILQTVRYLPELTKTVLNLIVFEEHTHKEVAALLGISERTSQWHFSNAKKTLTEKLLKKETNNKAVGL